MIVLVCGGRSYGDTRPVEPSGRTHPPEEVARRHREAIKLQVVLDALHKDTPFTAVVHGGAAGADYLAGKWARERGVKCHMFKAEWDTHGKAAGPIRNQRMLDEMQPDLVVAFPGDRGTKDMIAKAEEAGVDVMKIGEVV